MNADFRKVVANDPTIGAGDVLDRFLKWADRDLVLLESDENIHLGGTDCGRTFTVAGLHRIVDQLVSWLLKNGVRPGLLVGIYTADSPLYYFFYISLTRIGAIPVFLNSHMPANVAIEYLRRVGCFAVALDGVRESRIGSHLHSLKKITTVLSIDDIKWRSNLLTSPLTERSADDVVLICHTSGTTGAPKAVQFNHSGFFFGVRKQMHQVLGRKVLSALPHSHASALTMFMSTAIRSMPLLIQTQKDAANLASSIEHWKPNLVMAFPKPLTDLCRERLELRDFSSVSCWMSTGDASHERHIKRLISFGHRVAGAIDRKGSLFVDNLGSSEFGFAILRNIHSPETSRYDRCIGRPFEWADVEIFDENGELAPPNTVGRLGVRAPSVTSGYWKDAVSTQANILHGYWLTGDLVYRTKDGLYYHVDRTPDRALIANRAIYSCQLEEFIMKRIPEIFDCTVVATDSSVASEALVAVEPLDTKCDQDELKRQVHALLRTSTGISTNVRIDIVEPGWNEGVTGKKLKRTIRATLGNSES